MPEHHSPDPAEQKDATLAFVQQMLFSAAPAPMLVVAVDSPRFTIIDVNDAYLAATLQTRARLVGRGLFDAMPDNPDDFAATGVANLRASIERAIETKKPDCMPDQKYDISHPAGGFEVRWWEPVNAPILSKNGEVVAVIHHVIDATERVRADEALRSLNDTLEQKIFLRTEELQLSRDIIESCADPICAFDNEFRLIAFNQAHSNEFFRMFARRVQLGGVLPDLLPPDQALIMRGFMTRALLGESYTVAEEFGDPTLLTRYWEFSYSPLYSLEGRIIGAFHYARDITEHLRAEAELGLTQEALRQSQKIELIGQLTGGVAHDFNNLLTVIRASTDLLQRPNLTPDRSVRYITAISETVDRATKLTGQLLAFARRQTLKPEVFDVCESVRALSGMMGTLTGSRIRVITDLPSKSCYVSADLSQFDTALVNMAVNARDAMKSEGVLTIKVETVDLMPAVRSHPAVKGNYVAISITDTGSGISQEHLGKIFEPFFTTKNVGEGTGLGLSQVFGFAKQSGGEVVVNSEHGRGTTFTLYLARIADAPQAAVAAPSEPLMDGHGTCVLVVEDNADVGAVAVQALTDLGYLTVLAANAEEALAELARNANRFDVVFSDVVMPGMNGVELAHRIRAEHYDLPVLLTSGYSHVLAQNGTDGFELLQKPYSVEQLSRLLRKVATWQRRKRILGR